MIEMDENERRTFDRATANLFGGDALANVENTLSLMSRAVPQTGSFGKLLAICAEEVGKARTLSKG